jgi:predicted nucleic acid-binding protein
VEWINELHGKTIGLDTAPLIYFIEENPTYLETVRIFFEAMEKGGFMVVTSTVTLLEVLVHPLRNNNRDLATEYRDILLGSKLTTLEVSSTIAEQAAQLRADYNLRTPDAIQISAAITAGASHFLTNDIRLPEIPFIRILSVDTLI